MGQCRPLSQFDLSMWFSYYPCGYNNDLRLDEVESANLSYLGVTQSWSVNQTAVNFDRNSVKNRICLEHFITFFADAATSSARKAVVKPRFYLFSKHFDVLAYLKHVNVSEFPVLFPRPTNEEEEFPGLPPDVGRLVIGHVVAKHPMPIATEKLDSSSTDSSGAVRNLLHLNKIAHF